VLKVGYLADIFPEVKDLSISMQDLNQTTVRERNSIQVEAEAVDLEDKRRNNVIPFQHYILSWKMTILPSSM
jgi:uncharacterized protein YoxC